LPVTVPSVEATVPSSTDVDTTVDTTPVTAAPGAGDDAVPGDLAVPGHPMQRPPCDGSYITVLASPIGGQATAGGIAAVLDQYPGSNYLRTDQTCSSLNPSSDGQPIYVIFLGPFVVDTDACAARADGPDGAYARQLSNDVGPQHSVACA
jgi:serine/threonine-protein kinase